MPNTQHDTERLILRRWRDSDRDGYAAMNADPRVMEFFPSLMTREQSDASADRIAALLDNRGFTFWAVEVRGGAPFIGFCGLAPVPPEMSVAPAIQIGWRLAAEHWGHGYATEAARAALDLGFRKFALHEIVSYTVPSNVRSRHVMDKIGLHHDVDGDFDYPGVPLGNPMRRHVLYRVARP